MNGEKIRDWIKVIGVIVVLIATLYGIFMNFATKEEMNRRFTEMKQEMSRRFDKVERQLERMNQNFIDHLRDHNNP